MNGTHYIDTIQLYTL